jgi:hypothetical protein
MIAGARCWQSWGYRVRLNPLLGETMWWVVWRQCDAIVVGDADQQERCSALSRLQHDARADTSL